VPVVKDVANATSLLQKYMFVNFAEVRAEGGALTNVEAEPGGVVWRKPTFEPTGTQRPAEQVVRVAAPEGTKDVAA